MPKKTATPFTRPDKAARRAPVTLGAASEPTMPSGYCEPVSTTGLPNPLSANDRADAVYAIVSVPCSTTNASASPRWAHRSSRMRCQSSGVAFDESMR